MNGVYDPMHDLEDATYSDREENLKRAELMISVEGRLGSDAAKLYRELGEMFIIFLMKDAKEKGDEKRFRKLWQSAHKRRAVNSKKVDEIFESC